MPEETSAPGGGDMPEETSAPGGGDMSEGRPYNQTSDPEEGRQQLDRSPEGRPEHVARLTAEERAAVLKLPACQHCLGRHARACPRVRELRFHTSGTIAVVKFWPDGKWPTDQVIWPEQLVDTP